MGLSEEEDEVWDREHQACVAAEIAAVNLHPSSAAGPPALGDMSLLEEPVPEPSELDAFARERTKALRLAVPSGAIGSNQDSLGLFRPPRRWRNLTCGCKSGRRVGRS